MYQDRDWSLRAVIVQLRRMNYLGCAGCPRVHPEPTYGIWGWLENLV
jgi:hypothetical protein